MTNISKHNFINPVTKVLVVLSVPVILLSLVIFAFPTEVSATTCTIDQTLVFEAGVSRYVETQSIPYEFNPPLYSPGDLTFYINPIPGVTIASPIVNCMLTTCQFRITMGSSVPPGLYDIPVSYETNTAQDGDNTGDCPGFQIQVIGNSLYTHNDPVNGGTITSNDGKINCGSTCEASDAHGNGYMHNEWVTLTANPASGYIFDHWNDPFTGPFGNCDDVTNPICTVQMDIVHDITAVYTTQTSYHLECGPSYTCDSVLGIGSSTCTDSPDCLPSCGVCNAPEPACDEITSGYDNCGSCTKNGGSCASCTGCSAPEPLCGQTKSGLDSCGNTCYKNGPPCSSCSENAYVTVIQPLPATMNPGQTATFTMRAMNTGSTRWYHGMWFNFVQKAANLVITPSFSQVGAYPGSSQDMTFSVTAPSTLSSYYVDMQMVHRAGANYQLPSGAVCSPAPASDVYFGNIGTVNTQVVCIAPSLFVLDDFDTATWDWYQGGVLKATGAVGDYNNSWWPNWPGNTTYEVRNPSTVPGHTVRVIPSGPVYVPCGGSQIFIIDYTPIPINGVCGSSNGASFYSAPGSNLCNLGNLGMFSGTGPWSWICNGINDGSPAPCSANKKQDGVCGPAAKTYPATDTAFSGGLCNVGGASPASPTFPTYGNPTNWTCLGVNGGVASPTCTAYINAPAAPSVSVTAPASAIVDTDFTVSWTSNNATSVVTASSIMPPAGCTINTPLVSTNLNGSRTARCSTGVKRFQITVANAVSAQAMDYKDVTINPAPTLSVTLNASPSSGTTSINSTLTAVVTGNMTETINYSFWWNCSYAGASVAAAIAQCGDPNNSTYGNKFDGQSVTTKSTSAHTYNSSGSPYTPLVIVERGSLAARDTATVAVNVPPNNNPSVSNVTANGIDYCSGRDAAISWTYSDPDGDPQASYRVVVGTNSPPSDPYIYNPGAMPGAGTSTSVAGSYLQPNTTYYVRVMVWDNRGGASNWSPVAQWTTPLYDYPGNADFTTSSTTPLVSEGVILDDTTPYYAGGVPSRTWSSVGPGITHFNTSTSNPAIVTFSLDGIYNITLTARKGSYTCFPKTVQITVGTAPDPAWKEVIPR